MNQTATAPGVTVKFRRDNKKDQGQRYNVAEWRQGLRAFCEIMGEGDDTRIITLGNISIKFPTGDHPCEITVENPQKEGLSTEFLFGDCEHVGDRSKKRILRMLTDLATKTRGKITALSARQGLVAYLWLEGEMLETSYLRRPHVH